MRSPKSNFNSKIEDRRAAAPVPPRMVTSARPRGGASVETVDSCGSCVRTRSASTLGECAVLRRMGYLLAKPCRKCGCGIAVPSRDEKDEKDAAGVDEHAYAKVCERAKARAGTEQQSSAAAQQSSAAARQSSRRAEQQSSAAAEHHSRRAEQQSRAEQSSTAAEQARASRVEQQSRAGLAAHQAQIDRLKNSVSKLNNKLAGKARENEQLSREKEQQSARLGELYQDISRLHS